MVGKEYKKRKDVSKKLSVRQSGLVLLGLFLIALSVLTVKAFKSIVDWSQDHYIQENKVIEVKLQKPWTIKTKEKQVVLSPIAEDNWVNMTPDEIINQAENTTILRGVYFLESANGRNDGCKDYGTVNGLGFGQHSAEFRCYANFGMVVRDADEWFTKRLSENGNNIAEALCFYNRGIAGLNTCEYSQTFLTVLGDIL